MPTYRNKATGAIYDKPTKHGKYLPHYGAKESAKFAARHEPEMMYCQCGKSYGTANHRDGYRFCGRYHCQG